MKKTIVAAAVAAVFAAPAMADVKISGAMYYETGVNGANDDTVSETYYDLVFSGSEDLGNGMKAGFKIVQTQDNAEAVNADTTDEGTRTLSLSGDFGSITTGWFESYTESDVMSMAASEGVHTISIEPNVGNATMGTGHRYTSPSFQGVKVIAEAFNDGVSTVGIEYSGNGITAKYASEASVLDVDSFAIQYKMGDFTVKAVNTEANDGDEMTFAGATYTMGANTFGLGLITDAKGNDAAKDGDMTLSLAHALSKQTTVQVAVKDDDDAATEDETILSLVHKF
jgi:hypothetical protein